MLTSVASRVREARGALDAGTLDPKECLL